ncbi:MAG: ArsR family transcriptional regulator, partial [bacterium]
MDPELGRELASLLVQVGVDDKPARVVGHLAAFGEGRSADIEGECRMRQPEVSQATKILRERGWIVARREKKPGKGRPVNK